ncbi:MAG: DUF1043 family protein [Gammaproteobacteria bacterium]
MPTLSGFGLVVTVLAFFGLGILTGYVFASMRARLDGGGRTPVELKQDFDDYQARVDDHFVTTNELLGRLTAQYREVYAHMAAGARDLCRNEASRIDDPLALDAPPAAAGNGADDRTAAALEQAAVALGSAAVAAGAATAAEDDAADSASDSVASEADVDETGTDDTTGDDTASEDGTREDLVAENSDGADEAGTLADVPGATQVFHASAGASQGDAEDWEGMEFAGTSPQDAAAPVDADEDDAPAAADTGDDETSSRPARAA